MGYSCASRHPINYIFWSFLFGFLPSFLSCFALLLFLCSCWSFVDVPLVCFSLSSRPCTDWQPLIVPGMVEARSVNLKNTHTHGRDYTVTGTRTRTGMGAGTGAGRETRIGRRVEGRESPGTCEVMVKVGRKTEKRGGRQRVTNSHSRVTRRPSKTAVSCGGPESRYGRLGTGSGGRRKGQYAQEIQEEV